MKKIKLLFCLLLFAESITAQTPGAALSFDGMNDGVLINNSSSVQLTTGTIEAWIKTSDAGSGYRGLVVKRLAYGIFLIDNELACFDWAVGGPLLSGQFLNDNAWHHVALTFSYGVTNGSKLYLDGILVKIFTYNPLDQSNALVLGMGTDDPVNTLQNFNGWIDEVRVWDRVLVQDEIMTEMGCELNGTEVGLVSYYRFNQGIAGGNNSSVNTLTDATGTANTGTLCNFALNGNSSNWEAPGAVASGVSCGPDGATLNFDGINDGVLVANNSILQINSGTIECWIKTADAGSGYRGIIVKRLAYGVYLLDNELACYDFVNNVPVTTGVYLNDDQWHHIAFSFEDNVSNGSKLFVDGLLVKTFTYDIGIQSTGIVIGQGDVAPVQNLAADLDEVRIWNRIVPPNEIQAHKHCELSGSETGLLLYYKFNQGHADGYNGWIDHVTDAAGSADNGALQNFARYGTTSNWTAPGAVVSDLQCLPLNTGKSLSFDGINDRVALTSSALTTSSGTAEAWFKTTGLTALMQTIFAKQYTYYVTLQNNQLWWKLGSSDWMNYPVSLNDNQWHHVALTFSSADSTSLYLDGNLIQKASAVSYNYPGELVVGAWQSLNPNSVFGGWIDEFRIWNSKLSQSEIQAGMNCERVGNEPNLVLCYHFNQGVANGPNATVTTAMDATAQNLHGSLMGFALNGSSSNWVDAAAVEPFSTCNSSGRVMVFNGKKENTEIVQSGIGARLYPNPTEGALKLVFDPGSDMQEISVRITNLLGREVYSKKEGEVFHLNEIELKEDGIYLVSIKNKSAPIVKKVVVTK